MKACPNCGVVSLVFGTFRSPSAGYAEYTVDGAYCLECGVFYRPGQYEANGVET